MAEAAPDIAKKTIVKVENEEKASNLRLIAIPEKVREFTVSNLYFGCLSQVRHLSPDKMWISAAAGGTNIVLVDRMGNVIHNVDTGCRMYHVSGTYCKDQDELIFSDIDDKQMKKITTEFRVTTLFKTGNSIPHGISQLQSGDWVVCMADKGVLRVYDGTGNVVREIGEGHLQRPFYVTLNNVNGDICVTDNNKQVVVFSSNGEKRFTYTGDGTGFNAWDLCCDQLGNILITDREFCRVHIIDKDGHFLQYLVSGSEDMYPVTIDTDDKGHAWVGESKTRKVKAYKYLL